ncbi:protein CHROMATIN REMODELING 24 [Canna indica]|uniref:Protein CHROMATIN REMODELING 24 n=1 Tax=Canna indica TaxID=4628 RepID=A0AAQ3KNG1_9LILI|nr:protein CHROMATIN REMODELING 24 [Canna indica]
MEITIRKLLALSIKRGLCLLRNRRSRGSNQIQSEDGVKCETLQFVPLAEEKKPLSLNERNARLRSDLSRPRPPNPNPRPEVGLHKVKIEGRRRLCKLSSSVDEESPDGKWLESPPGKDACRGGDSIRDILDDLTSRLDALSVEKPPKPRAKAVEPEPIVEYESAPSSLSPSSVYSSPEDNIREIQKGGEVKGKEVRVFSVDDDVEGEEDCVVLERGGNNQNSEGKESEGESGDCWGDDDVTNLCSEDDEGRIGSDFTMAGTGFSKSVTYRLPEKIFNMLYPHQREGLSWLWSIHCGNTGGILGDDMGLGKTMQVSAFLAGLFHSHLIKRVLIVAPKTLLSHWMKELSVVGLNDKTRDYSGPNATHRQYELKHVLKEGGILLTTYDIVRNNSKSIKGDWYVDGDGSEEDILWDYTVLDEGHIIKNPSTQRSKSISDIPSSHRVIISGTPIQNNLKELWALFSFCCPDILGDKNTFKARYESHILRGNDKNASDRQKHIGSIVAKELRERIQPYFLRRMKSEVFPENDSTNNAKLSKKSEIIVWLKLTACQRQLYEAFLNSDLVHDSLDGSPLAALTILKKICDHPLLLTKRAAEGILEGMDSMLNREELGMVEAMATNLANMTDQDNLFQIMDHNVSCKIAFIMSLLENLVEEGHVVLIFSQTRKMLNLVQEAITYAGYRFLRIDGTTKISEREKIVKDFQEGPGAPIFLLTSQVGGLGLTLTKADRVIVVDPAWNPSTDNQSVDRAYRIGQKNDVIVYRLMTCGTIEEKIYKMQVFKGGLFRTATEHKEQTRYFSQKDISELFSLPEQGFDVSLTQQQLQEEHDQQLNMDEYLKKHMEFLQGLGIAGVSHHSLLYSKTAVLPMVPENIEVPSEMGNRIVRSTQFGQFAPSNGAEYAFNPKDEKFHSRAYTPKTFVNSPLIDSPEDIESKIKRLSQTLGNKALVDRLPDSGEKIRRQISELRQQLQTVKGPTLASSSVAGPVVINLDDVTEELNRISM